MTRVIYQGPPHPVFGLVSMLEDDDYEVDYDLPDMQVQGSVEVDLLVTDAQSKGVDGVQAVVQEFTDRHTELPVTIRIQPQR